MSQKSKLFSLADVKLSPSSNGFDLSKRTMFSCQPGQLLPIWCKEVLPKDKFKINVDSFTRTQTVNTAAFSRFKEYYDFFFVPTRLLWSAFPNWIVQSPYSDSTRVDYSDDVPINQVPNLPHFSLSGFIKDTCEYFTVNEPIPAGCKDELGFNATNTAYRLLDLLGYGRFYNATPWQQTPEVPVNIFPVLAYQKIYQDFYRHHDWENFDSTCFNVDWFDSMRGEYGDDLEYCAFSNNQWNEGYENNSLRKWFALRYANYKKDYFLGVRPSTQYGDVSVVSSLGDKLLDSGLVRPAANGNLVSNAGTLTVQSDPQAAGAIAHLQSEYSVLALRKAEALQRWKEVTLAHDHRYKAQIRAHFGFDVPDSRAQMSEFIDGFSNVITIQEVEGTASTDRSDLGQLAGKGYGIQDGSKNKTIEYAPSEHGYLFCIYHVEPLVDFPAIGIKRQNFRLDWEDYYQPAFQNIGLDSVLNMELVYSPFYAQDEQFFAGRLGYAPRYLDYKTDYDEYHGEFIDRAILQNDEFTGTLSAWITHPMAPWLIDSGLVWNNHIDYRFFKISPSVADTIFAVKASSSETTDQFLCAVNFGVLAVRPMSVDGMPY